MSAENKALAHRYANVIAHGLGKDDTDLPPRLR
jgi:hypothetical protein